MKKIKYVFITILLISIILMLLSVNSNAASATITAPSEGIVGEPITISVSGSGVQWNLSLLVNDAEIAKSQELDNFESNKSISFSGKYTPTSEGKVTVTLKGSVTEVSDGNTITSFTSKEITIKAKAPETTPEPSESGNSGSNSGGSNSSSGSSSSTPAEQPKQEITFTAASGTVYTTTDSLNFRSTSDGSVIGSIPKAGTELEVTGTASDKTRVKYNGKEGYVASKYVTSDKPEEETKSDNANLKSLSIENVTLSPEFKADVTSYKAEIGNDINEVTVKAEAEDSKATIDVKGNKDLKAGENKITVSVSAEDGTAKIYEINVTKKDAVSLGLKTLKIKDTDIEKEFKTDKYNYTVSVKDVDKLDITTEATIEKATVEILGNENLQDGENTVTIMVKSEDGKETVTYQIKVNKNMETAVAQSNNENKLDSRVYLYGGICLLALIILIALIVYLIKNKSKNEDEYDQNDLFDYDNEAQKQSYKNEFLNQFEDNKVESEEIEEEPKVDFNNDDDKGPDEPPRRGRGKHF